MKNKKSVSKKLSETLAYDQVDTVSFINPTKQIKFEDLGLKLPDQPPTQVISIRLPTDLLNKIKALGSQQDIPYQALIKLFLSDSLKKIS